MERPISKSRASSCFSSQSAIMESTKLRGIFPDEVWLMILDNVIGWKNYQQICKANQHFALLAKEQRTKILFSSVVDLLCKTGYTSQLPVLQWRKVCRSWKSSVDASLQCFERHHQPLSNDNNNIRYYYIRGFLTPLCEVFKNREDIENFMQHFKANHNPFLFRKVKISCECNKDTATYNRFMCSILELLDKFGKHIWYFCLELQISDLQNKIIIFKGLEQIIFKLPNLKILKFEYDNTPTLDFHQETLLKLSKRPYPLMPNLKSLECMTFPNAVLECLLQQAPNVTNIQMDFAMSSVLVQNTLSRLKTLRTSMHKICDFHSLETSKLAWNITQLELDVSILDLSWRNVFRVLENQFSDTLQKLSIRLPTSPVYRIYGGLLLPKLRDLHLHLNNFVPLDFLVPMRNTLEILSIDMNATHLNYPAEEIYKQEEIVEFYRHRVVLQRSNIWTQFTRLDKLKCSSYWLTQRKITKSFTRDQWKYFTTIITLD